MDGYRGDIKDVLVVDDNPGDRRFIEEAFRASQLDLTVHTVESRYEALDVVYQRGEYDDGPEIDVILLDWRLSQTTSEEVLTAAKAGESDVPVIVMTGSKTEIDGLQSSVSQAEMVIEKPTDPDGYVDALRSALPSR